MAIVLAVTVACVRRGQRGGDADSHDYRPLGNMSDIDIGTSNLLICSLYSLADGGFPDPKLYVSAREIKLLSLIGHGSFASVHRGQWRGTTVAVKKLHPHMRESSMSDFVREASLMLYSLPDIGFSPRSPLISFRRHLRHPNIVALMAISRDEETISIITEYLERGSLDDILRNEGIVIEPEHVRCLALDAAKGMTYLHAAGVIHRDLKCGNLLVDKDWNVKVPFAP